VERIVWGIAHGDRTRAAHGARVLLSSAEGATRVDTLHALVGAAGDAWGHAGAAALLAGAEQAPWPPEERDRTLLLRAALELAASDTSAAVEDAQRVARGAGETATDARLWIAGVRLSTVERVQDLDGIRPVLLPGVGDPRILSLLEQIRKIELLERRAAGRDDPLALFAAAELARDVLASPRLARTLFVGYADLSEDSPWAVKALLAALALSPAGPERETLRRRIDESAPNPYLRAAGDGWVAADEYERLESTLREALALVVSEVTAEAEARDVLVRERSDTVAARRR